MCREEAAGRDSVRHFARIDRDITKIDRDVASVQDERLTYLYIPTWLSHASMRARARANLFASSANVNIQALLLDGRNIISFTSMTHVVEISESI